MSSATLSADQKISEKRLGIFKKLPVFFVVFLLFFFFFSFSFSFFSLSLSSSFSFYLFMCNSHTFLIMDYKTIGPGLT